MNFADKIKEAVDQAAAEAIRQQQENLQHEREKLVKLIQRTLFPEGGMPEIQWADTPLTVACAITDEVGTQMVFKERHSSLVVLAHHIKTTDSVDRRYEERVDDYWGWYKVVNWISLDGLVFNEPEDQKDVA